MKEHSLPRLLMDVDGPIANFQKLYLDSLLEATGIKKTEKEWDEWDTMKCLGLTVEQDKAAYAIVSLPHRAFNMSVHPGAQKGVLKISTITDLYFVTSPLDTSPTWQYDRNQWLRHLFGELGRKVAHTADKHICSGEYLVDDKPSNLEKWSAEYPNSTPILWDMPHNESTTEFTRVSSYDELYKLIADENLKRYNQG